MNISKPILTIIFKLILSLQVGNAQTTDTVFSISPNPFQTSTNITIHNLSADTVTFKIYNRWGDMVAEFFEDIVLSGTFSVTFSADTLPNDVYVAILTKNGKYLGKNLIKTQNATNIISHKKNEARIQIYPNPTSNLLNISTDLEIQAIEIYDLNGKLVLQFGIKENIINLQNLETGLYFIHLITKDFVHVKKFIKE